MSQGTHTFILWKHIHKLEMIDVAWNGWNDNENKDQRYPKSCSQIAIIMLFKTLLIWHSIFIQMLLQGLNTKVDCVFYLFVEASNNDVSHKMAMNQKAGKDILTVHYMQPICHQLWVCQPIECIYHMYKMVENPYTI